MGEVGEVGEKLTIEKESGPKYWVDQKYRALANHKIHEHQNMVSFQGHNRVARSQLFYGGFDQLRSTEKKPDGGPAYNMLTQPTEFGHVFEIGIWTNNGDTHHPIIWSS